MDVISRIESTVAALRAGGVHADRGFPQGMQTGLTEPVVAVSVEHSDRQESVLKARICGPAAQGGRVCEDLAQTVAQLLRGENAHCEVGSCRFDGDTGLFTVEVLAAWQVFLADPVKIDGKVLAYVTELSAVQTRQVAQAADEETGVVTIVNEADGWTLSVTEWLPLGENAAVDQNEPFTLTVHRENCVETYASCYWTSITLEETNSGLIRKRVAKSWEERVVA